MVRLASSLLTCRLAVLVLGSINLACVVLACTVLACTVLACIVACVVLVTTALACIDACIVLVTTVLACIDACTVLACTGGCTVLASTIVAVVALVFPTHLTHLAQASDVGGSREACGEAKGQARYWAWDDTLVRVGALTFVAGVAPTALSTLGLTVALQELAACSVEVWGWGGMWCSGGKGVMGGSDVRGTQ